MTSLNGRTIFLVLSIGIGSFLLTWNLIQNHISDYDYPVTPDFNVNFPNRLDFQTENRYYSKNCSISLNYLLWSRKPQKVDWPDLEKICPTLLWPPARNRSDPDYNATATEAKNWTVPYGHTDESILNLLSDCSQFRRSVPFPTEPASETEAQFPLAYVFVAARNLAQTLRLFRTIYQPQNAYCITYDNKTSENFKKAIRKFASCFFDDGNVFLTPKPENIFYTHFSILNSVTTCLDVLLKKSDRIPWRYVQIVSWNDFPLRTNSEMVRIFDILNGSQDSALDRNIEGFYVFYHDLRGEIYPNLYKSIPPDGLTMYKGSYATSMTRDFVQFLFTNPTSQKFYKWLNGSKCAEEQFWTTIVHNLPLNAPGAFPGECLHFYSLRGRKKPFISRYQVWSFSAEKCFGKMSNWSCVYGISDLPSLVDRPELMAHKLYEEYEPAALFCLENWYWGRHCDWTSPFDEKYYENLPSVKYHKMNDKNNFICK